MPFSAELRKFLGLKIPDPEPYSDFSKYMIALVNNDLGGDSFPIIDGKRPTFEYSEAIQEASKVVLSLPIRDLPFYNKLTTNRFYNLISGNLSELQIGTLAVMTSEIGSIDESDFENPRFVCSDHNLGLLSYITSRFSLSAGLLKGSLSPDKNHHPLDLSMSSETKDGYVLARLFEAEIAIERNPQFELKKMYNSGVDYIDRMRPTFRGGLKFNITPIPKFRIGD